MKTKIDMENWSRKEHYKFFAEFDDPFFNLTTKVDGTETFYYAKNNKLSFFICYLYASLKAANETEEFRLRLENDQVILHDEVHASPVIMLEDNSFRFAYLDYKKSLLEFHEESEKIIEKVKTSKELIPSNDNSDVIHYSAIPWIEFSSLKHPRKIGLCSSIPKITFGKVIEETGKKFMPVNVEANHALMDAYHLSKFFERFAKLLNNPIKM